MLWRYIHKSFKKVHKILNEFHNNFKFINNMIQAGGLYGDSYTAEFLVKATYRFVLILDQNRKSDFLNDDSTAESLKP